MNSPQNDLPPFCLCWPIRVEYIFLNIFLCVGCLLLSGEGWAGGKTTTESSLAGLRRYFYINNPVQTKVQKANAILAESSEQKAIENQHQQISTLEGKQKELAEKIKTAANKTRAEKSAKKEMQGQEKAVSKQLAVFKTQLKKQQQALEQMIKGQVALITRQRPANISVPTEAYRGRSKAHYISAPDGKSKTQKIQGQARVSIPLNPVTESDEPYCTFYPCTLKIPVTLQTTPPKKVSAFSTVLGEYVAEIDAEDQLNFHSDISVFPARLLLSDHPRSQVAESISTPARPLRLVGSDEGEVDTVSASADFVAVWPVSEGWSKERKKQKGYFYVVDMIKILPKEHGNPGDYRVSYRRFTLSSSKELGREANTGRFRVMHENETANIMLRAGAYFDEQAREPSAQLIAMFPKQVEGEVKTFLTLIPPSSMNEVATLNVVLNDGDLSKLYSAAGRAVQEFYSDAYAAAKRKDPNRVNYDMLPPKNGGDVQLSKTRPEKFDVDGFTDAPDISVAEVYHYSRVASMIDTSDSGEEWDGSDTESMDTGPVIPAPPALVGTANIPAPPPLPPLAVPGAPRRALLPPQGSKVSSLPAVSAESQVSPVDVVGEPQGLDGLALDLQRVMQLRVNKTGSQPGSAPAEGGLPRLNEYMRTMTIEDFLHEQGHSWGELLDLGVGRGVGLSPSGRKNIVKATSYLLKITDAYGVTALVKEFIKTATKQDLDVDYENTEEAKDRLQGALWTAATLWDLTPAQSSEKEWDDQRNRRDVAKLLADFLVSWEWDRYYDK